MWPVPKGQLSAPSIMSCAGDIAHLLAPAGGGYGIGGAAHGLGAAGQTVIRIAQLQRLHDRNDRLRAGAAKPVDVHRRHRFRHPGLHRGDAGEVHVARLGVDDVAEDHVADLSALDPCPSERGLGRNRRQSRSAGCSPEIRRTCRSPSAHHLESRCPSSSTPPRKLRFGFSGDRSQRKGDPSAIRSTACTSAVPRFPNAAITSTSSNPGDPGGETTLPGHPSRRCLLPAAFIRPEPCRWPGSMNSVFRGRAIRGRIAPPRLAGTGRCGAFVTLVRHYALA